MTDLEQLNTEEGWKGWIDSASPQLATIAWGQFMVVGAGCFLIDFQTATNPRESVAEVAVSFVKEKDIISKTADWDFSPDFFGALLESLYTYDPEMEIVFCLRKPNGDFSSGIVGCTPSPPEAYLQRAGDRPTNIIEAMFNN